MAEMCICNRKMSDNYKKQTKKSIVNTPRLNRISAYSTKDWPRIQKHNKIRVQSQTARKNSNKINGLLSIFERNIVLRLQRISNGRTHQVVWLVTVPHPANQFGYANVGQI